MGLKVVGAGVGRTGTKSLKEALEVLLGGTCHHMYEVMAHPEEIPVWMDAIHGKPVDWSAFLSGYVAQVDWPGASFWPELMEANPEAIVLLSVRDPEAWYESCSNTIFQALGTEGEWMEAMRKLLHDRFSDRIDDRTAMIEAFERHNDEVRRAVPADRLLEWTPSQGWGPICEKLGLPIPEAPFPHTNTSEEFRARLSLEPQD